MTPNEKRILFEDLINASATQNFEEIGKVWSQHYYLLRTARGIFAVNDPRHFKEYLPPDTAFGKQGFLRSLLGGRRLGLIKNRGEEGDFRSTFTISFDSNFASFLRSYVEKGDLKELTPPFIEAIEFLLPYRSGVDLMLYLFETARQPQREKVHQTLRAFFMFIKADEDLFRSKRKFVPVISGEELNALVSDAIRLSEESKDWKIVADHAYRNHLVVLIAFLKMAQLQFTQGSRPANKRFGSLLAFFNDEVGFFPQYELLAAHRFFISPKQDRFFQVLDRGSKVVIQRLRSMAWDLSHVRTILDWTAMNSQIVKEHADFPIPYFLSFDYGIMELVDIFRLQGLILRKEQGNPATLAIHNLEAMTSVSNLASDHGEYFTEDATRARLSRGNPISHNIPALEEIRTRAEFDLIAALEAK